jgi:hypothetical protein
MGVDQLLRKNFRLMLPLVAIAALLRRHSRAR